MEQTIREMMAQADDERNFDLIRLIKEILDEFAFTCDCPPDWRYLGSRLAREYPEDSWVYENLELYGHVDREIMKGR